MEHSLVKSSARYFFIFPISVTGMSHTLTLVPVAFIRLIAPENPGSIPAKKAYSESGALMRGISLPLYGKFALS
jgi:hypothetical protein